MNKSEFLSKVAEIGTCEDEATRREMLAELQDGVSEVYDTNETLTETNATLTGNNEKLREANMKLFLRVGESKDSKDVHKDTTGIEGEQEEKLKFEDLFDEKGGLK